VPCGVVQTYLKNADTFLELIEHAKHDIYCS